MEYALGMIETHGHTAAIEALDAANKASNIILPSMMHVGSGRIAVSFFGDVSAVKVAVDAGVTAAEKVGKVLGSNVIARLDKQVLNTLFSYASSDNNTVEDDNKEIKENEEKNTEENKQLESNTEIINENADISSSNINAENASFFDEDVNKKTDGETASNESVSKKKTRKKKKNDNQ